MRAYRGPTVLLFYQIDNFLLSRVGSVSSLLRETVSRRTGSYGHNKIQSKSRFEVITQNILSRHHGQSGARDALGIVGLVPSILTIGHALSRFLINEMTLQ